MIAGTLALLEETADDPLESFADDGHRALEVKGTQEYLDGAIVQHGRVAAMVESRTEDIIVEGDTIDVETIETLSHVWTPWVADVTDGGFVLAERTVPNDPPFPFGMFESLAKTWVDAALIDVAAFVRRQRDADREWDIWMAGRKEEVGGEDDVDNTKIAYGEDALRKDAIQAEVGVGFETTWRGSHVKGVVYTSGYVAVFQPSLWGPVQFARFVSEEILPVAERDVDEEEEFVQEALEASADGGEA